MKNHLSSCEFNMDTACVELQYADSNMIDIDCDVVEAETAKNLRQRTELNRLIYHAPLDYAELILKGDIRKLYQVATM
ncbi:MAG: hypothetical protein IKM73_14110 [Acidaminococcaceae bacterium]|nr:hypothetical protein [Acidaminococcaceae bacterium]